MSSRLRGKIALVFGAASRGHGWGNAEMGKADNIKIISPSDDMGSFIRVLIIAIAFMAASPVLVMPVIVGSMMDTLGINAQEVGLIVAAEMIGSGLAALILSLKVHSWNRRYIIYGALFLFILSNLTSIFTSQVMLLVLLRFMAGIGGATTVATVKAALATTKNPDRSFGLYIFLGLLFGVGAMPGFSYVVSVWGLQGAYVMFVILGLVAVSVVSFFPHFSQKTGVTKDAGSDINYKLASLALISILIYFIGQGAVWTYMERIGVAAGIESTKVGGILGIAYIAGGIGAALSIVVGSRFGRNLPTIMGIFIVFFSVILLKLDTSYIAFVMAACGFSFAVYLTIPYFFGLLSILDTSGRVVVLGLAVQATGMAIGPAIAGMIVEENDYSSVEMLGMGCFIGSLLFIIPFLIQLSRVRTVNK